MSDANLTIHSRCQMWGAPVGAGIAGIGGALIGFVSSGEDIPDLIGWTIIAVMVCGCLGLIAGQMLAAVIELRAGEPPLTKLAIIIPPDLEAIARKRFNVPGEPGTKDGVKREDEVRRGE